jgi:subtilisin-like proprotein convertase family protein
VGIYAPNDNSVGGRSTATDLLSDFNGLNMQGLWTLTIRDLMKEFKASLGSWSIDASGGQPAGVTRLLTNSQFYKTQRHTL